MKRFISIAICCLMALVLLLPCVSMRAHAVEPGEVYTTIELIDALQERSMEDLEAKIVMRKRLTIGSHVFWPGKDILVASWNTSEHPSYVFVYPDNVPTDGKYDFFLVVEDIPPEYDREPFETLLDPAEKITCTFYRHGMERPHHTGTSDVEEPKTLPQRVIETVGHPHSVAFLIGAAVVATAVILLLVFLRRKRK